MEFFRSLGDDLDARWRAKGRREEAFPSLAAAALHEHGAPTHAPPERILEWLLATFSIPHQNPRAADAPLTLYSNDRFRIYALFWIDGTTVIHDHSTWGAFQVLAGSSLHTTYAFTETERITSSLALGDLTATRLESLKVGDVREITCGRSFIHSLFHLDRPSVTIAAFTKAPPQYASLFAYLPPGFAYESRFEEPLLTRQLGALELIGETSPGDYEARTSKYVARAEAMYAFHALKHAHTRLDEEAFGRVLEAARDAHPRLTDVWGGAFRELRRQYNIIGRRAIVHDPDHRYFLAVLLNARGEDVFRLVRERRPDRDPVDTIVTWVKELSAIPVDGPAGPTAIGVPLDESSLLVLRALLLGREIGGVLEMLRSEFDDVDAQEREIVELVQAFRESLFFAPLLARR